MISHSQNSPQKNLKTVHRGGLLLLFTHSTVQIKVNGLYSSVRSTSLAIIPHGYVLVLTSHTHTHTHTYTIQCVWKLNTIHTHTHIHIHTHVRITRHCNWSEKQFRSKGRWKQEIWVEDRHPGKFLNKVDQYLFNSILLVFQAMSSKSPQPSPPQKHLGTVL